MVLPGTGTNQQVAAGLSLAAGLGSLTGNRLVLTATTDVDWERDGPLAEHVVVVGTPYDNQLIRSLNDAVTLPVALRTRRLELETVGPASAAPGVSLSWTRVSTFDG